jgi:hypothetical protein
MSDFAEEIFSLLGNPNDSLRLSTLVDSFELGDSKGELQEVIVKVNKDIPPLEVKWIRDILSEYDMFYQFTIVQ